jgi:hypothetical protein
MKTGNTLIFFVLVTLWFVYSNCAIGQNDPLKQERNFYENPYKFQNNRFQSTNLEIPNVVYEPKVFSGNPLSSDSVIILRSQLIDHFVKDEIEEVKKIKNILWEGQLFAGENLSYREYWLIMFWTKEYDTLLELKQKAYLNFYKNSEGHKTYYTTISEPAADLKYVSFYRILQEKSDKFQGSIKKQIRNDILCEDRIFLNKLLHELVKSNAYIIDKHYSSTLNINYVINTKASNLGFGWGICFQKAWYGGEISNYVHNHTAYKIFSYDFYYKRLFTQFVLTFGTFEAGYLNINGDTFHKKFYGSRVTELGLLVGYEVISNSTLSIIPNIGYVGQNFLFSTTKGYGIKNQYSNLIKEIGISDYSLGLIVDYKLFKMQGCNGNYASLRFQYDYCFTGNRYELYDGNIHQFAIGFIVTFRGIKIIENTKNFK